MQHVQLEDYKQFVVYCLQYKTLIIEQLSELKERQLLELHHGNPPETENGYGVILQCTIIRDLKGMGMEFLGHDSKAVLKATMDIAQANFPEMLFKNHIVNAPWIFNTIVSFSLFFSFFLTLTHSLSHTYSHSPFYLRIILDFILLVVFC